jgi:ferredoxin
VGALVTHWVITVDRSACIGSGMCAGSAPGYFGLVDGKVAPHSAEVAPDHDVAAAADNCPMEAILVTVRDTGMIVAPEL